MKSSTAEFIFGLSLWGFFLIGVALVGEAVRAHVPLFLCIWVCCPIYACALNSKAFVQAIDVPTAKWLRGILLSLALLVSAFIAFAYPQIRDGLGKAAVDGYRVYEDESGWRTATATGTFWLKTFGIAAVPACFLFPWVTWAAMSKVIRKLERQIQIERNDGERRLDMMRSRADKIGVTGED